MDDFERKRKGKAAKSGKQKGEDALDVNDEPPLDT